MYGVQSTHTHTMTMWHRCNGKLCVYSGKGVPRVHKNGTQSEHTWNHSTSNQDVTEWTWLVLQWGAHTRREKNCCAHMHAAEEVGMSAAAVAEKKPCMPGREWMNQQKAVYSYVCVCMMGFYHAIWKCNAICAVPCRLGHRQIQLGKECTFTEMRKGKKHTHIADFAGKRSS